MIGSAHHQYVRPPLYPAQEKAVFTNERNAVIEASTKSGKTYACITWLFEQAALRGGSGKRYWWVAPVAEQAAIAYRRLRNALPRGLAKTNDSAGTITLPNGAVIVFRSGDNPDSLYGDDVHAAVLDEATRMREEAWHAVRTTLTATRGQVRIIGNVKGRRNWAYALARRAEAGDPSWAYARLTWEDAVEGGVITREEIELARNDLPVMIFRELYEARAAEDQGNPFGLDAIARCIGPMSENEPIVWGWDLAKTVDWTVGIALDHELSACRFERFKAPWDITEERIVEATGDEYALVDSTGVGDPIVERLQKRGSYQGKHFSSTSKQQLIERLRLAIQRREVTFPDGPIRSELEAFEYSYGRTSIHYSAPSGAHDDSVIALALAIDGYYDRPGPGVWL